MSVQVNATWGAVTKYSNGQALLNPASYNLYRGPSPNASTMVKVNTNPITETTFLDVGPFNPGETYVYALRAVVDGVEGPFSSAVQIKVAAEPAAPGGLTLSLVIS